MPPASPMNVPGPVPPPLQKTSPHAHPHAHAHAHASPNPAAANPDPSSSPSPAHKSRPKDASFPRDPAAQPSARPHDDEQDGSWLYIEPYKLRWVSRWLERQPVAPEDMEDISDVRQDDGQMKDVVLSLGYAESGTDRFGFGFGFSSWDLGSPQEKKRRIWRGHHRTTLTFHENWNMYLSYDLDVTPTLAVS